MAWMSSTCISGGKSFQANAKNQQNSQYANGPVGQPLGSPGEDRGSLSDTQCYVTDNLHSTFSKCFIDSLRTS